MSVNGRGDEVTSVWAVCFGCSRVFYAAAEERRADAQVSCPVCIAPGVPLDADSHRDANLEARRRRLVA